MFCAIATTIERCKTEGVVDVFQVVKALRVQKPGAVRTVVRHHNLSLTLLTALSPNPCLCRDSMKLFLTQFLCFWTLLKPTRILVNNHVC